MIAACKVLRIDLAHLEQKTYDDLLQKHHAILYDEGGNPKDAPILAKAELDHHERRRMTKVMQLEDYKKAMLAKTVETNESYSPSLDLSRRSIQSRNKSIKGIHQSFKNSIIFNLPKEH